MSHITRNHAIAWVVNGGWWFPKAPPLKPLKPFWQRRRNSIAGCPKRRKSCPSVAFLSPFLQKQPTHRQRTAPWAHATQTKTPMTTRSMFSSLVLACAPIPCSNRPCCRHGSLTVFQPFGDNRTNPSYLIASSLPTKHRVANLPLMKIHAHPEPITVAYKNIRETIPKLLFPEPSEDASAQQSNHPHAKAKTKSQASKPNFDLVLHIGMAPGRKFYTLETCAHREGYNRPDVDDETLTEDVFWKQTYDAPKTLHPDFDTDDVWRRWKSALVVRTYRIPTYPPHL